MTVLPEKLRVMVSKCLASIAYGARPSIHEFLQCEFFHDMQAKCLQFLEGFEVKDRNVKAQFLKQLPTALCTFEKRVLQNKVLPVLLRELRDSQMTQFLLPNIMEVGCGLTPDQFAQHVLPKMAEIAHQARTNPMVNAMLLQNLPKLFELSTAVFISQHLVPLMMHSFMSEFHE